MFIIKITNEVLIGKIDPDDETVSEAIFSTYSDYTYDILLMWNELVIPLDRRGDLSEIYNDIVFMLDSLKKNKRDFIVSFLSSTFTAKWHIQFEGEFLKISPKWITVTFSGKQPSDNQKMNRLLVRKIDFINEWNALLKVIKQDLTRVGYNKNLKGFDYLNTL